MSALLWLLCHVCLGLISLECPPFSSSVIPSYKEVAHRMQRSGCSPNELLPKPLRRFHEVLSSKPRDKEGGTSLNTKRSPPLAARALGSIVSCDRRGEHVPAGARVCTRQASDTWKPTGGLTGGTGGRTPGGLSDQDLPRLAQCHLFTLARLWGGRETGQDCRGGRLSVCH